MQCVYDGRVTAWEKVGEQSVVGKGFGVAIVRQKYKKPNASLDDFDFLSRRKTGITVFALTPDGKIIIKEEFKPGTDRICWAAAEALIDGAKESPYQTAHRELREETGFTSPRLSMLPEDCVFGDGKYDYGYLLAMALECVQAGPPTPTEGEVGFSVYLLEHDEFWEAVNTKKIRACQTIHAASVAASLGLIAPNPLAKELLT